MKSVVLSLGLLAAAPLAAQTEAPGASASSLASATPTLDIAVERSQVERARQQVDADFAAQEANCYARFAVSDCLVQARKLRRTQMDDLHRKDVLLNDAERRQNAQVAMEKIAQKNAQQAQENLAQQRAQAQREQQERQDRVQQKAQDAAKTQSQAVQAKKARAQKPPKTDNKRSPAQMSEEAKLYQEKQREAAKHRVELEKTNKQHAGPKPLPLPTPH